MLMKPLTCVEKSKQISEDAACLPLSELRKSSTSLYQKRRLCVKTPASSFNSTGTAQTMHPTTYFIQDSLNSYKIQNRPLSSHSLAFHNWPITGSDRNQQLARSLLVPDPSVIDLNQSTNPPSQLPKPSSIMTYIVETTDLI
jgi:hypothetical protein